METILSINLNDCQPMPILSSVAADLPRVIPAKAGIHVDPAYEKPMDSAGAGMTSGQRRVVEFTPSLNPTT
jgi:hypothetical protein